MDYENKTEKEVDSTIRYKINLKLQISKILKFLKKMKKVFLLLTIVALATTYGYSQIIQDEDFSGSVMILDSTNLEQDMKLLIVNDRLYSKNGLVNAIVQQASKEKAETGKIVKQVATQKFLDDLNNLYSKYSDKFIKVDTVYVDSTKINNQIKAIQEWQNSVLNDNEIKNVTSLGVWEQKNRRLEKLLYYQSRLK